MCLSGLPDFITESANTVSLPTILKTKWTQEGRYNEEYSNLTSYLSSHNMKMTVTNCITYWLQSWVREYGVDGFRCDTAKHVDLASWKTLKTACVEALRDWKEENPDKALDDNDFWMTGEVWDHGVYKDDYYTQGGFDSIINFSTQGGGILGSTTVANTYQGFADSINSDPDFNVLSYISSHDSVLCRGNSIYMGSAFLLCPGAVQTYYGDETDREIDSSASANGQHNLRSDMNWDSMNEDTLTHWQKVGTFRNSHIAVGAGQNASLTTTNGVAFSRTYSDADKDIYDKIAAVIGCDANTDVTVDVSDLWADGQYLVNAYDYSSAVVTDGKITFNSGINGTILIEEPDGKPLANVSGNTEFSGTEEVTLNLSGADSAKVSVDGAHKFIAHDGDTFTIGETAYDGDTVKVTVEATNDQGTRTSTFTFCKVAAPEVSESPSPTESETPTTSETPVSSETPATSETPVISESPSPSPVIQEDVIYVKSDFVPYVYAWKGSSTALSGTWPGTKMTEIEDGYYKLALDDTDSYNVVINNGSGKQTADITGLQGVTWITVSSSMSYTIDKQLKSDSTDIVYIKADSAPYCYAWKGSSTALAGAWPGTKLTETENGYYKLDLDSNDDYNVVLNNGSGKQTTDITGLSGTTYIQLNSDYSYEILTSGTTSPSPSASVSVAPSASATPTASSTTSTGKNTFTFNVSSYTGAAPYLYIWDSENNTYNGGFPGKAMTEKSEDGQYYTMTIKSDVSSLNCIISYGGNQTQSCNISGITGTVTITNDTSDYKSCTVEKTAPVESNYSKLKTATRAIKNMSSECFTEVTWKTLNALVTPADELIYAGEEDCDEEAITSMLNYINQAKANLQLAAPVVNDLSKGDTNISGTAAYESTITVTIGSKTYTTTADDVTGEWSVDVNALTSGSTVKVTVTLNSYNANSVSLTV